MIQLLAAEAVIFEGLKSGKAVAQIAKELGDKKGHTNSRVQRMLDLGLITREGYPKRYVYYVPDEPYEIVEKRAPEELPVEEDTLVNNMIEFKLSDVKVQFIRENYKTKTRSELSKMLRITKLELNFVMHKLKLKPKEGKES